MQIYAVGCEGDDSFIPLSFHSTKEKVDKCAHLADIFPYFSLKVETYEVDEEELSVPEGYELGPIFSIDCYPILNKDIVQHCYPRHWENTIRYRHPTNCVHHKFYNCFFIYSPISEEHAVAYAMENLEQFKRAL